MRLVCVRVRIIMSFAPVQYRGNVYVSLFCVRKTDFLIFNRHSTYVLSKQMVK